MNKWLTLSLLSICFLGVFGLAFFLAASPEKVITSLQENDGAHIPENTPEENDQIGNLYLTMNEVDLNYLYSRDAKDDQRIQAIAVDGSLKEHNAELRFRGNSSRGLPKKSFSIQFDSPKEFIFGGTHMNLNAMYTDPSMMREKLSFDMFHELGLPAPRTKYFNVYVNGSFEGLYLHIERIDDHMLSHFGLNPSGTLVRDEFRHNQQLENIESSSIFSFDIQTVENKAEFLEQTTNYRNDPDWEAFSELLDWVYHTEAGTDFANRIAERVDTQAFIDWLIIHFLVADVDAFSDDYWMYLDSETDEAKWKLIPWDKDLSFGSHYRQGAGTGNHFFAYESPVQSRFDNQLLQKFLDTPELRAQLNERMQYLMSATFSPSYFQNKMDELSAIFELNGEHTAEKKFILHEKNSIGEKGHEEFYKENILDFIELRYQYLTQYLEGLGTEKNAATIDVTNVKAGDVLYLRDKEGWVIGKVDVESNENAQSLTVTVQPSSSSPDIDRSWVIETSGGSLKGHLTLY
jgi:spore coat protein H